MKWDIDKANAVMWIASEAAKSFCGSMKEKTGINFTEHFCYILDHNFKWCSLKEENKKVGNFLVERFKNKKFADKFLKDYKEFGKKTIKELNEMDKKDFSKLNKNELFGILKKTTDAYIKNFDWGFIIEPMDFVMPELIESRLLKQGHTTGEIADMLAIADIIFLNRESQELIEIAKKPKKEQEDLLKKHSCKYRWLQSAHMGRKDIPLSYFKEKLEELKEKGLDAELERLKNFKKDAEKRKKEILKKKPVDKETMELLKVADLIAPPHDRRKELFMRTIYTLDTAREEIARRYGYTKDELSVFDVNDILKLKEGKKLDKGYARKLCKEGLLYIDTKKNIWKYYYGKEAREIAKKELTLDLSGITEIKGMPASLGRAEGTVKIVHGVKDMIKMEKGDILVASMTRPEFVPAMKKAAAIITDEGGVTCHAAIVSRELNIPCIIGTKIASEALKDGDLVEVDADNGIVRKMK